MRKGRIIIIVFICIFTMVSVNYAVKIRELKEIGVTDYELLELESEREILTLENQIYELSESADRTVESLQETINELKEMEVKKLISLGEFEVTAYDLSVQSCGKDINHPEYGITASGVDISGMTRKKAMTIAVDPEVIPLGSKVYIEIHNPKYSYLSGIYTARDTGRLIKGHIIDLYLGEDMTDECMKFGRQKANVYIIN